MLIQVTQEDIDAGERNSPWHCMIAKAVSKKYPNTRVAVAGQYVEIGGDQYKTSQKVREVIQNYDAGEKVEPFKFFLTEKI